MSKHGVKFLVAITALALFGACGSVRVQESSYRDTKIVPNHSIELVPVNDQASASTSLQSFLYPDDGYQLPNDVYIGALHDTYAQDAVSTEIYQHVYAFSQALISGSSLPAVIAEEAQEEIQEEVTYLQELDTPPQSVRIGEIAYSQDNSTTRVILNIQSSGGNSAGHLYLHNKLDNRENNAESNAEKNEWEIIRFIIQRDGINALKPISTLPFSIQL